MEWYDVLALLGIPTIISTIVGGLIGYISQRSKNDKKDRETTRQGIQALLRNALLQDGERFIKAGYADNEHKQNYDNMFNCYHNLGKNGVMNNLHDQVMLLPIEKPEAPKKGKNK